jgi:hypothetical protein
MLFLALSFFPTSSPPHCPSPIHHSLLSWSRVRVCVIDSDELLTMTDGHPHPSQEQTETETITPPATTKIIEEYEEDRDAHKGELPSTDSQTAQSQKNNTDDVDNNDGVDDNDDNKQWVEFGDGTTVWDPDSAQDEEEMEEGKLNRTLYPRGIRIVQKVELTQSDGSIRTITASEADREMNEWRLNLMAKIEEAKRKKQAHKRSETPISPVSQSTIHLKSRADIMNKTLRDFMSTHKQKSSLGNIQEEQEGGDE